MKLVLSRVSGPLKWALLGRGGARGPLLRLGFLGIAIAMLAASCAEGTYPLDFFYEMHYQPSYHSQEPPRLMPAEGSVPITGKEIPLRPGITQEEIDTIQNPIPGQDVEKGAQLFAINCSMCHGMSGKGDGQVLKTIQEKYGHIPQLNTDLTLVNLFGYSDGTLFVTISDRDLRPGIDLSKPRVMPQFRKLLTAEERWMLINYIREGLPGS